MEERVKKIAGRGVDAHVACAWTLPAEAYTDPGRLAAEQKRIFARTWQPVGRAAQLANPGDYFTTQLVGEPLLLARDSEGKLRGFYNVCRHRAGPPAEGCGSRKLFRCGYHGWTYGLDGRLISAPEFEGVENFRREEFGLVPVRTEEWSGLIFANLDEQAPSLGDSLGQLPQAKRFGLERMKLFERRDYLMECNWKVYIDNFLEGYHLPSVHPSLNRELDYGGYATETYSSYCRQWSPIRGAENEDGGKRRYQSAGKNELAEYFWIFPNWMLNCYPDNVSLNIIVPLSVDRTVAIFEWYFPEGALATETPQRTVKFSDEIQLEDGRICEVVHRNLHSRSYDRGRFSVKQEKCVHHFHRLYSEWMGER